MSNIRTQFQNSVENDLLSSDFGMALLEKYQLLNKIYESAISQIFVVREYTTKELYTLKAINKNTEFCWDLDAMKNIDHPKIAHVIDVQTTEKYIYMLKEYINGLTLEEYAKKIGLLSEETVLEIAMELCEILGYFHSLKPSPIIYRDLKPANLIITESGEIRLIDLDSVRQYKKDSKKDTFYIGTEGFASPEQFGFSQTDNRTDIYTLGTTLYYLITGKRPENDKFRLISLRNLRRDISDSLIRIIEKCTAFNPENRYQSIDELKDDLLKLNNKGFWSKSTQVLYGLFRKTYVKVLSLVLISAITVMAYYAVTENKKNNALNALDKSNMSKATNQSALTLNRDKEETGDKSQTSTTLDNSAGIEDANQQISENSKVFSFNKTTIIETFWSGDVPQKLPVDFVEHYKQGEFCKYNPSIFYIAIKEWDFSHDYPQMSERIKAVGGKLLLRAKGYKDVEVEMNGDSMTSGDGSGQIYLAYVRNDNDLVPEVKYEIVDTTGHWIVDKDVYIERKAQANKKVPFSFDKTTINEAFWSGDEPKTLSKSFIDLYKKQSYYKYGKSLFFISISEWDFGNDNQMIDRIKKIGGNLILRAKGYKDLEVEMSGSNITNDLGTGQAYLAYVKNESDMVSGVKYQIIGNTGHWIIKDGAYVIRPVADSSYKPFDYNSTTITEAFWSGELPKTLSREFIDFYKQQYSYTYNPNLFFINIKEWDPTQDYTQMAERLNKVGDILTLRANGYKDVKAKMNGHSMEVGNGLAQVYAVNIVNIDDFVSGVKYKIVDNTGHWKVDNVVYLERPIK